MLAPSLCGWTPLWSAALRCGYELSEETSPGAHPIEYFLVLLRACRTRQGRDRPIGLHIVFSKKSDFIAVLIAWVHYPRFGSWECVQGVPKVGALIRDIDSNDDPKKVVAALWVMRPFSAVDSS